MSKSRARLAADWFAKLRQNAVTQEVEHTDVVAAETEALEAKADAAAAGDTVSSVISTLNTPNSITANTAITNIDFGLGNNFIVNMSSSTTFIVSNLLEGQTGVIYLKQDGVGGRTFTLPVVMKTPNGGATIVQLTTANTSSILSYTILDTSTVLVNYIGDYA